MKPSFHLCAGTFRGGEIEPGTFHSAVNGMPVPADASRPSPANPSASACQPVLTEDPDDEIAFE